MKKLWIVAVCVLLATLCGCSAWMNGYYASVTPHKEQNFLPDQELMTPKTYEDVVEILEDMVKSGQKKNTISTEKLKDNWQVYMDDAVQYICSTYPLGTYAVSEITYDLGADESKTTLAVDIAYKRSIADIDAVKYIETDDQITDILHDALRGFQVSVAIGITDYRYIDFEQIISDYAVRYPQYVIEEPRISAIMYPRNGKDRIVELIFNYETGRTDLLQMKEQIRPIFDASEIVSGEGADADKFARLYSFLMNYHQYTLQASLTPAYSLLHHGVGDSRAFAMVYAAMCRQAGLTCSMVSGVRDGRAWHWNAVEIDGSVYYIDLLRCREAGAFSYKTQQEMTEYVWDYSAY